jgi:hypothetical protein
MVTLTAHRAAFWEDLGVDVIEEFSVLTSNHSVEYGKTAGREPVP